MYSKEMLESIKKVEATREERIKFQAECIAKLTAWADALPEL